MPRNRQYKPRRRENKDCPNEAGESIARTVLELTVCVCKPRIGQRLSINRDRERGDTRRSPSIRAGTRGVSSRPEDNTLGEGMPQRDAELASETSFLPVTHPGGVVTPEATPARNGAGSGRAEPSGQDEELAESRLHNPDGDRIVEPAQKLALPVPLQVVMLYDMDACHGPTGVTRHALAQLERLARRDDVA